MQRSLALSLAALSLWPIAAEGQVRPARLDPGLVLARWARFHPRARVLFPSVRVESVGLALRFATPPGRAVLGELERHGAVLAYSPRTGEVLTAGTIVGAVVPWDRLDAVLRAPGLVRAALGRPVGETAPMDVSVPDVGAPGAWRREDRAGLPLTGRGIAIADVDTAVDFHHPMFFFADGGEIEWIDVDGDGRFTDGIDAADVDGDGAAGAGETLRLQDARRYVSGAENADGRLQAGEDWLYVDADGDGRRDYGTADGYGEDDPCFGEILVLANDADRDDALDVGETLTALGTSKVRAIYEYPGRTRLRGVDLLESSFADSSHGTGVSSVLVGGWPRQDRRFAGIAPEAELVVAARGSIDSGISVTVPWAIEQGADVVLYEYGSIASRFLDGTDEDDLIVSELAKSGVPQVTPTGNWGDAQKAMRVTLDGWSESAAAVRIPERWELSMVFLSLRWRRPEVDLEASVVTPSGTRLPYGSVVEQSVDGIHATAAEDVSDSGTVLRTLLFYRDDGGLLEVGDYLFEVENPDAASVDLWGTVVDDVSGFGGGARFVDHADELATVASPATADGAIGVGSYSTRQSFSGDLVGQLSGFSGRGPRIDGASLVDVVAPGDYDVFWALTREDRGVIAHDAWGYYALGGGTSAAGPHVAGAVALLLQARPDATAEQVENALRAGALADDLVGDAPNEEWGAGKLRIVGALEALGEPTTPDAGVDAAALPPDAGLDAATDAAAPDAEAPGGETDRHPASGCGCRTADARGAAWPWALAALPCLRGRQRARRPRLRDHDASRPSSRCANYADHRRRRGSKARGATAPDGPELPDHRPV